MNYNNPFVASKYSNEQLHKKISYKGRDEQENRFLFPFNYGGNPTRNEIGAWTRLEQKLSKDKNKKFKFHN
jgi:hypothetical protein